MRLYALLILAAYASAAAVPALDVKDLEKKLVAVAQQAQKDVVVPVPENTSSEQELLDQANAVNEVENNLKRVKITDIPVKVVVEDVQPAIKADIVKEEEDTKTEEVEIKRVEIDLNNPGLPQRQEHETQNPEHYEQPIPANLKKIVVDTQAVLKQGFEGINQGIVQNWFTNNQQIASIQQGMQDLQNNFFGQLNKLNQTLQNLISNAQSTGQSEQKDGIEKVQDGLRNLENNFQNGLRTLTKGDQSVASVRAEGETGNTTGTTTGGTSGTTDGSSGSTNPFVSYLQNLQNTLTQGFSNITTLIQNTFTGGSDTSSLANPGSFISGLGSGFQNIINGGQPTTASGAQADEGVTTSRPGLAIWQGIQNSIQNILNPGQNQAQNSQPAQPSQPGPIAQAIQNSPIVQGVVNLIQPNRPGAQQPAAATEKPAEATSQEGTNAVPVATAIEAKPEQSSDEKKPESTDGPIKKIIQNNPIVKGISGAVQRIQSLSNPEKPRDTLEGEKADSDVKGLLIPVGHGHGGGAHSGDNNNSDVKLENEPEKKDPEEKKVPEEPVKDVEMKEEKKEESQPQPETTENKTE